MSRLLRWWPAVVLGAAAVLAFFAVAALGRSDRDEQALRAALVLAADRSPGAHARAEAALLQAARRGPRRFEAQAANVLAAFAVAHGNGAGGVKLATRLYRRAVRLDPLDEASKFDLELLLTLRGKRGRHGSTRTRGRAAPQESRSGSQGASVAKPGEGY